jgi:hypothetical protein
MIRRIVLIAAIGLLFPVFGWAEVYHIDPDTGSDANTGLSHAQALETWAGFIAKSPSTSDDVYIKCGTTLTPSSYLNITWGGTSGDPAVIGAYYLDGATEVYGVSGDRPIISGSDHTVPNPATSYNGLIRVYKQHYVTIENLHIYKSGKYGIHIDGELGVEASTYFTVSGVKTESCWDSGILIQRSAYNYGIVEDCEVMQSAWGWKYDEVINPSTWPGSLVIINCPYANTTVRRNYVHNNWGEGIGFFRNNNSSSANYSGSGSIVEDNHIWSNRRVDIYLASSDNVIVRHNMCLGALLADNTYGNGLDEGRYWNQYGIWLNAEQDRAPTKNHQVYNNIVVGHNKGIGISGTGINSDHDFINNKIYNNTLIGNRYNFSIAGALENLNMTGTEIKNNVSICPSDCLSADVQYDYSWISTKSGLTIDYNSWHSQPSNWAGTHDVATDSNWTKLSGWQSLTSANIPITNFMPSSATASVVDEATDLGSPYNLGISIYDTSYNIPISVTTVDRYTVGWDMGAVPYQGEPPPVTQYRYIGWTTSEGVPSTFPPNAFGYAQTDGSVALNKWTATENGTLKGIRISTQYTWDTTYLYGAVFKDTGDNLELIAAVTLPNSGTDGTWTTEYDFTSGSLDFVTGDDLYFGVPAKPTSASSFYLAETKTTPAVEDTDYRYSGALTVSSSCPTTIVQASLGSYTPRIPGVVVSYEPTVVTDEENPVITITAPTSDATYTLTGDNKISVSGTATDNTTVGYITWTSTDDSGNATGSLPWTTWEVNDIPVPTTGTTITVTGEDTSENTGSDTLTVSFSPPANSNVIGWDDGDNPPDASPAESSTITGDRIYLREPWTATEGGEIAGVYAYIGSTWDVTKTWGAVYKEVGSNYVVVGKAELTDVVPGKYQYIPVTVVAGQSLRFVATDKLLPSITMDNGTGLVYGRTTGGTPDEGMLYVTTKDTSDGPVDLVIATDINDSLVTNDLAITLVYTDLPGDITAPSVDITSPAAETATILSNHYTMAGTASDAVELDYVIWERAEDDEQGMPTVSDGAWSETIMLLWGTNTITTTAYDTTGNSSTDTVTITYAPEVFGGSVSGGFQ